MLTSINQRVTFIWSPVRDLNPHKYKYFYGFAIRCLIHFAPTGQTYKGYNMYNIFITDDYLISPINGYKTKRITQQNIKQFGFDNIEEMDNKIPNFPKICKNSMTKFSGSHSKKGSKTRKLNNETKYNENPKICMCGNIITYTNRHNSYCSRKCANSRKFSTETKLKISETNKKNYKITNFSYKKNTYRVCISCDSIIEYKKSKCSICSKTIEKYRLEAKFKFNIYDYPDYFDINLLNKHGMYSPANSKTPNINGVSRDHIVSISYGYANNIPPDIISHPANCRLILQSENSSKNKKCSFTMEELLHEIENWKY